MWDMIHMPLRVNDIRAKRWETQLYAGTLQAFRPMTSFPPHLLQRVCRPRDPIHLGWTWGFRYFISIFAYVTEQTRLGFAGSPT